MDYKKKYLKYKRKYLSLSNIYNQIGGTKPTVKMLKGINLFIDDSEEEKHLNPIYGFMWSEGNAIINNFDFNEDNINKLIRRIYNKNRGTGLITPMAKFIENIKPNDMGQMLAHKLIRKLKNIRKINFMKFAILINLNFVISLKKM